MVSICFSPDCSTLLCNELQNSSVETTSRITSCSIIFLIRLVATNRLSIMLQNNRQLVATNRLRYFYLSIFIH